MRGALTVVVRARTVRVIAALAGAVLLAAGPAATTAAQADIGDVMIDDVGAGWELVAEDPGSPGSLTRTWRSDGAELMIIGFAVTTPPGTRALFDVLATTDVDLDVVPEPALELASWLVAPGRVPGEGGFAAIVVASRDHIFNISVTATTTAPDAAELAGFVRALAERQVELAGGPPPPVGETAPREVDDDELLRFVPGQPPPGYGLDAGSLTLTGANEIETEGLPNPDVAAFLNDRSKNVARVWGGADLTAAVGITQYPYDIFAAAGLGGFDDREPARMDPAELAAAPDAVTFRDPEIGQVGAVFRRGDLLVTVMVEHRGAADEAVAEALVVDLVDAVAAGLPGGGTEPYEFPSPPSRVAGLLLTAGFVTAAVGGSTAVARLRARRVRRRWAADAAGAPPVPLPPPGTEPAVVVDLDDDAAALRRRGRVVTGVQLLTVNVGVVALAGDFAWAGVVVAAASMLIGVGFSRWWLGREHALLGPKAPPKAFVAPRLSGAVMGLVAFAVLGIGVSYLLKGVRYVILPPTLAQLRWSDLLGMAPRTVGVVFALGGVVMTALGAVLFRIARALGRARVRRVLEADQRPPVLYLRSFGDDSLPLPTIASARRPLFELFSIRGADPFEEAVAWELDSYGPVVSVGRPGGSLASLGAAREHLPNDTWRDQIAERMCDAGLIVLAPGETAGLAWELGAIVEGGHLGKTVFVFPPLAPAHLSRRWHHTAEVLTSAGAPVGALTVPPAVVHTVRTVGRGTLAVTSASMRDEATYRVAVDRALEITGDGPGAAATAAAGAGSSRPGASVS